MTFHIVVNPVASKFAKALQWGLKQKGITNVYRRLTPKTVAPRAPVISRKGNVLRRGRPGYTVPHFSVTQQTLNKVQQFERFAACQVSCPQYATNVEAARQLECKTLFARTLINSTNGRGIVEFERSASDYPRAPLYTEYIPKKAEYRFHVFAGKVIDVQEKRKKRGVEERNTRVRNVNNGYVYCRDDVSPPDGSADLAIRAVAACGYQYGAVDMVYNEKRNCCYVLEVNSRPGLVGSSPLKYAEAIIHYYGLTKQQN